MILIAVASPWIIHRPNAARRLRLYCFAYAGGHAGVFAPWQALLEPHVEVCGIQLPGRGARMREPAAASFDTLITDIAGAIAEADDGRPFAFFGHSLGSLLAFEVARGVRRMGHRLPIHLFLSGSEPAAYRSPGPALHLMSDDALVRELAAFNGTPTEVLANREMMVLLLPMLRADFALVHGYRYQSALPLDVPFSVLAGRRDDRGSGIDVSLWGEESTVGSEVRWFEGDHFFINSHQREVVDYVRERMLATLGMAVGGAGHYHR
ncbi:thioesterase [Stenotrophomonas sp. S48]|uniref:thioesterase II family protein n=1 Tax=unclassified Stenotrophomonas TaxID=196198 RepID=UPI0019028D12|nr:MULTISPECIES: alpha/beta fold hydrolase [unclassified Stenotrophomonas]MBK0025786.1 thioesterase [Stenotrophomonas sp. S48]MBK0046985.1 thioesterase [Stenotrophomonas sp. S49]